MLFKLPLVIANLFIPSQRAPQIIEAINMHATFYGDPHWHEWIFKNITTWRYF